MSNFQWRYRNPFHIEFSDDEIDPGDITPFHSSSEVPIVTIATDEDRETIETNINERENNENIQTTNINDGLINEQTEMKKKIIIEMRNNMNTLLSIINEKMNKESSDFNSVLEHLNKLTSCLDELCIHLE